jgi:hypothetical protein
MNDDTYAKVRLPQTKTKENLIKFTSKFLFQHSRHHMEFEATSKNIMVRYKNKYM